MEKTTLIYQYWSIFHEPS